MRDWHSRDRRHRAAVTTFQSLVRRPRLIIGLLALVTVAALVSSTAASASTPSPPRLFAPPMYPFGLAQDAAGNIFIASNTPTQAIVVIPKSDGSVFGQPMTAGVPTALTVTVGIPNLEGLAFDSAGNLFFANGDNNTVNANISVIASSSTSLFGVPVIANAVTKISEPVNSNSDPVNPFGLAFDSLGNLFFTTSDSAVVGVLPKVDGTLFGHAVTTNTVFTFPEFPDTGWWAGLAFDSNGNLFVTDTFGSQSVVVFPQSSGTLFGQSVTANTVTAVSAFGFSIAQPFGLAFDASGNLLVANRSNRKIIVLAPIAAAVFGQDIPANVGTSLEIAAGFGNQGLLFDAAGNLYMGSDSTVGTPAGTYVLESIPPVDPTTPTSTDPTTPTSTTSAPSDPIVPTFTG